MYTLLLSVFIFFTIACTSEKPGATGKQLSSGERLTAKSEALTGKTGSDHVLEITPQNAGREAVFFAVPKDFNLADGQIEWRVNGWAVPGATSSQFSASDLKRGDVVQVSVRRPGLIAVSNTVEIINSPPVITSMRIMPEVFKPGDVIYADALANDVDGDTVTITYEWTLNGQPVGTGRELAAKVKRRDKISVKATPNDGIDSGPVAVLDHEIANMPPVITDHKEFTFDGTTYTYQVKASDPDGDPLSYSLETAVPGMTINEKTGLLKWAVPPDFTGVQGATVVVKDDNGGAAQYTVKITINKPVGAKP
jgi:hypothetical protein